MPTLDLEVLHRSRRLDMFQTAGDPRDADWLRRQLRDWLTGHKWAESRWPEFEMVVRPAGRGQRLAKIRA